MHVESVSTRSEAGKVQFRAFINELYPNVKIYA